MMTGFACDELVMPPAGVILVVDDDAGMRETLADVLEMKGYTVEVAANGAEALGRLRGGPSEFDAAIVDIKLPDISGLDLLRALKAAAPDVEVVFITAYASLDTAIQAVNGGAFAYLAKPFEVDHLVATLSKAVEKCRLAQALRESEERYRVMTESINDAVFLTEMGGRVTLVNPRGEELTGYRLEELRGRPFSSLLAPESAREAEARIEDLHAGREVSSLVEHAVVRKDGNLVWVEANVTTLVRDGLAVGRLGVWRDITERKRLQAQLMQAEKLATLGELIAGVAHELNNPLSAVLGHAQLLRDRVTDPALRARAQRVVDQAQRAARVVRNFLTFARKHEPEKVSVFVNEVIARTLELLAYQFRVVNIEVRAALAPDLPPVAADPYQVQQVFLNLFTNAYHAMSGAHGRGVLEITTALAQDRGSINIAVADDGPGIAPEHLPRIFEPFFTTKPSGEGTGMGLMIVKGIVEECGGTIAVESQAGRGARFVVTLPVPQLPPSGAEPAAPEAIPSGLRILVVDDEPTMREVIAEVLEASGNRVERAVCGEDALRVLARSSVDVVVLDLRMPGMSGRELWTQLRRMDPALARRTVFCTGDVVAAETRAFLDTTGCLVVPKPFEPLSKLLDAVAHAAAR